MVVGGVMHPNPSPLGKLSLQLDGCRLGFVAGDVALVCLRDGSLYSLEIHYGKKGFDYGGVAFGDYACCEIYEVSG